MVSHQLGGKPAAGISLQVIFTLFRGRDVECMHTQFGPQLGTLTVARPATPRRGVGTHVGVRPRTRYLYRYDAYR
jgi:hypothetical protein